MNKSNSASKIKMKSFDDLFGTNENLEQANANGGEIREIPLASLHTFRNHPFQIHEDKLEEMVESVRQYGVLVPGIARMRPQGGYEIIAGHKGKCILNFKIIFGFIPRQGYGVVSHTGRHINILHDIKLETGAADDRFKGEGLTDYCWVFVYLVLIQK